VASSNGLGGGASGFGFAPGGYGGFGSYNGASGRPGSSFVSSGYAPNTFNIAALTNLTSRPQPNPNFDLSNLQAILQKLPQPQPSVATTQTSCGRSKFASPLIVGGELTQKGEWPWFASLFVTTDRQQLKLLCGGFLISTKHIATAAHCIEHPNEPHRYTVMLGRHNIADRRETKFYKRQVTKLQIHPDYPKRQQRADADIAILKMATAVKFNDLVQPVCLPKSTISYDDVQGMVVGYGKSDIFDEHTNTPRRISVRAVNILKCIYSDNHYTRIASERNFCAIGQNKSPCRGDSGGGFFVRDSTSRQWIVYGLVSEGIFTNGFCDVRKYVVFVDLTKFLAWIFQSE
jgi:secreted trypsin-like serine protease